MDQMDQSTSEGDDVAAPATGSAERNRSDRSRATWWIVAVVIVVAIATTLIVLAVRDGGEEVDTEEALTTVQVQRTDVIKTEELDGTLGFGSAETIAFRTSNDGVVDVLGLAQGFVTSIVDEGTLIEAGDVLYEVNLVPVVVLVGDIPAYRSFTSGLDDGADIRQLEQSLADAGYDPDGDMTIDDEFTAATEDAIERLQEAIGAEETGELLLGEVVFSPTEVSFVARTLVSVADQVTVGQPIVSTSQPISGTVTALPVEGSVIGQGQPLIEVDGQPVAVLLGDIPAFRTLAAGVSGDDVLQFEQSLAALGFDDVDGFEADGNYDTATSLAAAAWQSSIGQRPDGVVNFGDVYITPTPVRVGQNLVSTGSAVLDGTPIMALSADETFVTVELSTDDQDLVDVGDSVVVELPSGAEEPATVTEIGSVVLANQQGDTYFEMTVVLVDPAAAEGLDEAPVDVIVIGDVAENVLAVPVTALLALAEGGYAVEVLEGGETYLIGVEPGLFADGLVEVTSSELEVGMQVVVP